MFIERERPLVKHHRVQKVKEKILSVEEKLSKPFVFLGTYFFVRLVERNIVGPMKPEYPEGFANAFTKIMEDLSTLPIIISNHTGYADAAGLAVVSKQLTELANRRRSPENQFRGFMLTVAASIESAHQNIWPQQCIKQAKQLLPKYSISLGALIRKKDAEKYQMDRRDNTEYKEIINEILGRKAEREADGLAYCTEGTMEGGRRIKEGENKGQTKGMQRFKFERLDQHIQNAQLLNRSVVIIPVSIDGAFEVLDPDRKNHPTKKAIKAVTSPLMPKKSLLDIKVNMPIVYADLIAEIEKIKGEKITHLDIGDEIGRKISRGLPRERQGYYRDFNQ